jgi:hypothetical protein
MKMYYKNFSFNISNTTKRHIIENLLNIENDEDIRSLYQSWDMGDCSLIGLIEILLYQEIKYHKIENGLNYDTNYDEIKLRYNVQEYLNRLPKSIKSIVNGVYKYEYE